MLADAEFRQSIKEFSNWPTIPQLYVKGEFVGGCDIIREMFEAEELAPFFAERGVIVEKSRFLSQRQARQDREGRQGGSVVVVVRVPSPWSVRSARRNCHRQR